VPPNILLYAGLVIVGAYISAIFGPKPAPATLSPQDAANLEAAALASQQAAASAAEAQATLQAIQSGAIYQTSSPSPSSTTTSGPFAASVWYDRFGNAHPLY
jgi:hypothetical protein